MPKFYETHENRIKNQLSISFIDQFSSLEEASQLSKDQENSSNDIFLYFCLCLSLSLSVSLYVFVCVLSDPDPTNIIVDPDPNLGSEC